MDIPNTLVTNDSLPVETAMQHKIKFVFELELILDNTLTLCSCINATHILAPKEIELTSW
jgi:hypothetical protein